jgi:flagellin-like hook-associated protein FlgL
MSGITLSSSVRQNLLSLQSTADLLATTQSRLSSGNKVNTALDNPTNYFTAQILNARSSDINNLLDGIGNGVQIIQAANTGITSLQKLVDSAKSIANQALQTTVGFAKSTATSAASTGVTANDLLGTTAAVTNTSTGSQLQNNVTATFANSVAAGATALTGDTISAITSTNAADGGTIYSGSATAASGATVLSALTDNVGGAAGIANGETLIVNGKTITFGTGSAALAGSGTAFTLGIGTTVADLNAAINALQGGGAAGTFGTTPGKFTLATGTAADLTVTGTAAAKLGLTGAAATATRGGGVATTPVLSGTTRISGTATAGGPTVIDSASSFVAGDTITVNGKTISFNSGAGSSGTAAAGNISLDITTATVASVLSAIDSYSGATGSTVSTGGKVILNTGVTQDLVLGGTGAVKLGLPAPVNPATTVTTVRLSTPAVAPAITDATLLSGAVGTNALQSGFAVNDQITVNGTQINFVASGATGNDVNITDPISTVLAKINTISGGSSAVTNGKISLTSGTAADLVISDNGSTAGSVLAKLGLKQETIAKSLPVGPGITGKTLTIGPTGNSKVATTITFGADDAAGQVSTLDELNKKLAANNLQATVSTTGAITLTTTNDAASSDIGVLGGTITDPGQVFAGVTVNGSVRDPNSQAARASLVAQYNQVIDQIKTTAQDASFNGVNLLNGDTLSMTFNETGKSKLDIIGVNFAPEGLGLSSLLSGTDFIDNASTNKILTGLNDASTKLRSQASSFGSNLSVVQIRQDFSKNLINVLQTGASNLTLADTNEEAANSQALSTRQSIAVSALALANQSQQGVLQLLK